MTDETEGNASDPAEPAGPPRRSVWRRIAGDGSHVGFWTLPVFVATALGGAVIAGAIANVYYGQQVAALEEETRAARTAAELAAADIEAAREDALAAINEQVDSVRDALEAARPLEDPAASGIVALVIELTPAPAPSPSPDSSPSPAAGGDGEVQGAPAEGSVDPTDQPSDTASPQPPPVEPVPGAVAGAPTRRAVGFVVAMDGDEAFIATSYGAVADPFSSLGVAPVVTVVTSNGTARGLVHAWDEARHVAIIKVKTGVLPILPWRPAAVPVVPGDIAVLAAVTPGLVGLQLPGRIGAITADAILTDLPYDTVFDGGPVLDTLGRVIGLQASTANPFGGGGGAVIPAHQLCVELVSGCDLLEEADPSDAGA